MDKSEKQYPLGTAMKKIMWCLVSDFERTLEAPGFLFRQLSSLLTDVKQFRKEQWPHVNQAPVDVHKRVVQVKDFLKRFRFKGDAFTSDELEDKAFEKFLETQQHIAVPIDFNNELVFRVLQRARSIVKEVLGPYDRDEHISCCRIGRNATVGNPKLHAYLDVKGLESPVTGSVEMLKWLKSVKDEPSSTGSPLSIFLNRAWANVQVVSTLALSFVDKSYKAFRLIIVNTWVGAFYTKGLGVMIERRLAAARDGSRSAKLDIRFTADIHAELARLGSIKGHNVTLDLSSASDLFTIALICKLVPREWFNVLRLGRIATATYKGRRFHMTSFMTMGNGYTFPLQTLLFYALIRACRDLSEMSGRVSVYGDDCIFPRKLYPIVRHLFGKLNFKINFDKTFYHGNFRESCGSDFFHGENVRPYSYEGTDEICDPIHYAAFLYQICNGLLSRWEKEDIPRTYAWLLHEVHRTQGVIFQVPPDYPDYSGLRVKFITVDLWTRFAPVRRVYDVKLYRLKSIFTCISTHDTKRFVFHQSPYYLESLVEDDECDPLYGASRERLAWCEVLPPRAMRRRKKGLTKEGWRELTKPLYPYVSKKRIAPILRTNSHSYDLEW